ncbi:MAG: type VI secretion system protein TssA [Desulfovibrio sp.]|jgi:type VI secretion system protein VasJ|nr:type VI secretion system protein TssA [Desulfovibrio sp.]
MSQEPSTATPTLDPKQIAACIAPLPGDSPAGTDARYDTDYGAILTEIEKLSFSGSGAPIDWRIVEDKAFSLLGTTTKDFQLASYLAVAMLHNHGVSGTRPGIAVLASLCKDYWDTAFPPAKRLRGRINALDWWHERCRLFLEDRTQNGDSMDPDEIAATLQSLSELDEQVAQRMPDAAALRDLVPLVNRLAPSHPAQTPPPAEEPPAPAEQAKAPPKTVTDTAPPADIPEDPALLRSRFLDVSKAYLAQARRTDGRNPAFWRLSRIILWSGITRLPQADNGTTQLPAPDVTPLAQASRMLESEGGLQAALTAEDTFIDAPFLLDCQRMIHAALSSLDAGYAEAAEAVRQETGQLLRRLPGLENLRFADETPFASPETKSWLQECRQTQASQSSPSGSPSTPGQRDERTFVEAQRLADAGQCAEALHMLERAKGSSRAANLRIDVHALQLLTGAGKGDTALTLALAIAEKTAAQGLDDWDPSLAVLALDAVREALHRFDSENRQELSRIDRRIALLKPSDLLG